MELSLSERKNSLFSSSFFLVFLVLSDLAFHFRMHKRPLLKLIKNLGSSKKCLFKRLNQKSVGCCWSLMFFDLLSLLLLLLNLLYPRVTSRWRQRPL